MRTVKKMASAATIAVFLLCCFITASTGSQDDCVYAATGSNFTVPLRYKLKDSESLKWFKDTSVIFYRRQKQVITWKNDDVDSTGSLKLTQLTKDMSGRYRPEVNSAEGINVGGNLLSVHLCVLDPVKKPTVTMTCIGAQKNVSFSCNIGQGEMIKWLMNDKQLAEKGKTVTRVAKDVANAHFSCNVSNIVSSDISLPVQQNCYKLAPRLDQPFKLYVDASHIGAFAVLVQADKQEPKSEAHAAALPALKAEADLDSCSPLYVTLTKRCNSWTHNNNLKNVNSAAEKRSHAAETESTKPKARFTTRGKILRQLQLTEL
ncbi:uncharacterized protein LOC134621159 [Pelmatolapia mariae]|uniref:uncharacterized protein LOC134621159 n=1 Tax=Pelmatolapia mariae TaxID=158779 RepID=UPI003211D6B8